MATPLTRAEWLDECAKLAKTYEDAMTDEAKALVERVAMLPDGDAWPSTVELLCDLRDCVETQAREIERLRAALGLADAALRGANMNMNVVERKLRAALEARHD